MSIEGQKVNMDFNFKLIFTVFFSYFLYLQLQNVALEEMATMLIFELTNVYTLILIPGTKHKQEPQDLTFVITE